MLRGMKAVAALALLFAAWPAFAGLIEGRVIEVPDGTTLTVLSNQGASIHRIRLAGIDLPGKNSAMAGSSRENLRRLARGKTVRVDASTIDARGMLVGHVLIVRGPKDCGSQPCPALLDPVISQLSFGLAVIDGSHLAQQSADSQKLYREAQAHAKANRLGVWRETALTPVAQENARAR